MIREQDESLTPAPPPDQGPVLVWYRASTRGAVMTGVACAVLVGVILCFTRGTLWLTDSRYWPIRVAIPVLVLPFYIAARRGRFSAGADWVAKRGRWVRLYELEKVTCHGYPWGAGMYMRDSDGRVLRYRFIDLSRDRLLWDLTYNGILHSVVADNAKTNALLRKTLALPSPEPTSAT